MSPVRQGKSSLSPFSAFSSGNPAMWLLAVVLPMVMALGPSRSARGDEGGVSFWTPGQYASLAAVPANPGWLLQTEVYYYGGSADSSKNFTRGEHVVAGLDSTSALPSISLTYSPDVKLFGGQPSFTLTWGYGYNTASADETISSRGRELERTDSLWGGSDLYPLVSLAWNRGVHNWMAYVTGDIPVGAYDESRLANIGIGHGAVDAGGGYTYLNTKSGLEFSAVVGFTYNLENPSTNYKNGTDSHLDYAVSQFLSENWQVGIAGYLYYQLTGDSGSGATLGAFESKVAAIGPEIGYQFEMGGQQWYANVRAYYEFWAENRLQGFSVFATLSVPLGGMKQ